MDPITTPDVYDVFALAGQTSPGLCDIEGAGSPRKWDVRDGHGQSGATVAFTGNSLSKFKIKVRLYTPEEFAAWQTFRTLLDKAPDGTKPKSLDIYHPWLAELGIKSVVVEDVKQCEQPKDGEFVYEIAFIQWQAPKPSAGVPKGSKSTATPASDAGDAADKMIADLLKQVKAL